RELDAVDAWMVIDGVGTRLSTLEHTAMAQAWIAELAREHGKAFWVDVENAHMAGNQGPMTMEEFGPSLAVAARQGSQLITFDYAHYMSLNSPDPRAVQLHNDYAKYRAQVLGAAMHTHE
ncbi:MAG: hypothetical protein PWP23_3141, partial [Candidatus Sumerlaeota bacterium]|nr:hypothetical protein [Candidatus Sumerlaeota bacterium]